MNILEFLKNGSGIHIKEKNKGKFTKSAKAAGQSVQEHAKSVLNDPNATPLQKKRANFARNAAKWHHKNGGSLIKAQEGTKFFSKIGDFLNNNQEVLQGISQIFNTINNTKMEQELQKWKKNYLKSITPDSSQYYNQAMSEQNEIKAQNPDFNLSPIVVNHRAWELAQDALKKKQTIAEQEADNYIRQYQLNNDVGYGDLLSAGMGIIGNFLSSPKPSNDTSNYKANYTPNYSFKLSSFWDNPTLP